MEPAKAGSSSVLICINYQIQVQSGWGNASGIVQNPNGRLEGAADPRGEGTAMGY